MAASESIAEALAAQRTAPAAFRWAIFPVTLGAALWLAWALVQSGWNPVLAIGPAQLAAILTVALCERIYPQHRGWNRSRGDLPVDSLHLIVTTVTTTLLQPIALVAAVALAAWLSSALGSTLWPSGWPLLVQLILALVVGELAQYWWHRGQHSNDLLWRLHAVHHSAPRLYWLNAARFHPLDIVVNQLAWFVPLVALGCGEGVLALFALVSAVHGIFQHSNLQLRCGPLNWFFSMAELHRWHHSRALAESNHNYGQNLIVWDIVFGTRFLPRDREPPQEIGIADPELACFPMNYVGQILSPFQWGRIRAAGESS